MSEGLTKKLPDGDINAILAAIKNVESYVVGIDTRLGTVETCLVSLEGRLGRLEQRVDEKLHDTRPIWHKVIADIAELQAGVQRLEKGQEQLHSRILDLSRAVRDVNRDQIVINDVARWLQLDFHTIDERLLRLEVKRNPQNSST